MGGVFIRIPLYAVAGGGPCYYFHLQYLLPHHKMWESEVTLTKGLGLRLGLLCAAANFSLRASLTTLRTGLLHFVVNVSIFLIVRDCHYLPCAGTIRPGKHKSSACDVGCWTLILSPRFVGSIWHFPMTDKHTRWEVGWVFSSQEGRGKTGEAHFRTREAGGGRKSRASNRKERLELELDWRLSAGIGGLCHGRWIVHRATVHGPHQRNHL